MKNKIIATYDITDITKQFKKLGFELDADEEDNVIFFHKSILINEVDCELNVSFFLDKKAYTVFFLKDIDNDNFAVAPYEISVELNYLINKTIQQLGWNNDRHN